MPRAEAIELFLVHLQSTAVHHAVFKCQDRVVKVGQISDYVDERLLSCLLFERIFFILGKRWVNFVDEVALALFICATECKAVQVERNFIVGRCIATSIRFGLLGTLADDYGRALYVAGAA